MNRSISLAIVAVLLVVGCTRRVDPTVEAQALLQVDRAWAAATATGNVDSILSYWTDDARVLATAQPPYVGKPALRDMVTGMFAVPGFQITWTPQKAVVSSSGDLGYTTGENAITAPDAAGRLTRTVGRYLTVWRKGPDGKWRCVEDISNPGPPPTPAPAG